MSEAYSQIVGACASDIPEVLLSGGSSSIVFGGGWGSAVNERVPTERGQQRGRSIRYALILVQSRAVKSNRRR